MSVLRPSLPPASWTTTRMFLAAVAGAGGQHPLGEAAVHDQGGGDGAERAEAQRALEEL